MGLLVTIFGLICLQLVTVMCLNSVATWLNDRNKFKLFTTTLTNGLKPQVMWFMAYAFLEIMINVNITVIKPEGASNNVFYSGDWSSGDFVQIVLAGLLALCGMAFFFF